MIENKTVFSYVLPSTGNLVEYRGLNAKYGSYELDALDAAILVRLGTASTSFPSSVAALELYDTSGSKYLINGWPGSQANNLNFVGADGNQYYLSNRFINTGTAVPTYFTTKANLRCVATNNWFGYVDVSWQWYAGNTIRPVLETVYNQTGVEYRVRFLIDSAIFEDSGGSSRRSSVYITRSTGLNSWNQYYSKRVGGSTISRCGLLDTVVQRNVDGTWVDIGELNDEGGDTVYTGNIGPFSSGAKTYYGAKTGSGGVDYHLWIYSTRAT